MRIVWILSFFFAFPSWAANHCAPLDLRPVIGPPLHQGDSGYCFAHASAVLIRAKLGFAVSPMQLATNYILANPEEVSGAADPEVKRRVTPALINFWRNDRKLSSESYHPNRILTENGLIDTGGEELPTLLIANFLGLCPESRLPTGRKVYKKYLHGIRNFDRKRRAEDGPDLGPIGEVTDSEAREKAWSFRKWVENRCGAPVLPARPILADEVTMAKSLKEFRRFEAMGLVTAERARNVVMKAVDEQLDRGHPISFGYALGDLMPDAVQHSSDIGVRGPSPAEVDHASVIAGRKRIGEKCYYYVRNSFGRDEAGYRPQFKGRVEDGGVWVLPEEIPSLYSAVWLD